MSAPDLQAGYLRDQRLAAHALSPAPVWLWSPDGRQVLWANPSGVAAFRAASFAELSTRRFDPDHRASLQIVRLAASLPSQGSPRLERLRGFAGGVGSASTCLCSRIGLTGGSEGLLIVSAEPTRSQPDVSKQARRLLNDLQAPSAIFTAEGDLIETQASAREQIGGQAKLADIAGEKLAREARLNGFAEGDVRAGHASVIRLGTGTAVALLVIFGARAPAPASDPAKNPMKAASTLKAGEPGPHPQHLPFRFVWQTDAETRFTLANTEFADLVGSNIAALLGRNWTDLAAALKLDPENLIADALARRETFSGIPVSWPVERVADELLRVEMSGLPIFDRERHFQGFRGFGICRQTELIARLRNGSHAAGNQTEVATLAAGLPTPKLDPREHSAFRELARELSERLKRPTPRGSRPTPDEPPPARFVAPPKPPQPDKTARDAQENRPIFDRLPIGILIYRLNSLIYANEAFLAWTGHASLDELAEAGGLDSLFIEASDKRSDGPPGSKSLTIAPVGGSRQPVEGRLFSVTWNEESALALVLSTQGLESPGGAPGSVHQFEKENLELKAILDTAMDGVLILDRTGRILSANRSAQALFGYEAHEFAELTIGDLLVADGQYGVLEHVERLAREDSAGTLHAGFEMSGRVQNGGLVPLQITIGRVEDGEKLCAVLRDITAWKRNERELIDAKQTAEKSAMEKSEFLAKISHEIRIPLNSIIGFSEVMMEERFGPLGNERYRDYVEDIHACGGHVIALLNELLDLSKIEAGKLDLSFAGVNLNDLLQQCVAVMQQQANRQRVVIRLAVPASLPQVIADARSMRQVTLNLISNSLKHTGAGGQVIVSTAQTDEHEVVLRVRDTGPGMTEKQLRAALEPFRDIATTAGRSVSDTGFGLPITKALAEANQAQFRIRSEVDHGTLVEIIFPPARVLAQ